VTAGTSSAWSDVQGLARKSFIYGLGTMLLRSISLLVLPLYTRYLTPADYGIVALASTLTSLMSLVFSLSLPNAINRFFFLEEAGRTRRRMSGTIWLAMVTIALVLSVILDLTSAPLFGIIAPQLPFTPYVRVAIWTAFLSLFGQVPLGLLQVKEKPAEYVWWTSIALVLTVALTVLFVVVLRKGAYGYLLATLVANALLTVPYVVLTLRDAEVSINGAYLKRALAFSLPLVPHGLASWALSVSDRAILQLYVSLSAVGLYSLGYQFGSIMIMASGAISTAWWPFVYKKMEEKGDGAKPELARLVTYYAFIVCALAIALCIFSRGALKIVVAQSFQSAYSVVPIIVLGYLWNSLYVVPAQFLFVKSQTKWLPVVTVTAGVINVGINFTLIPRFGIMAAAWATFVAFLVMLILVVIVADRVFPFPYERSRLAKIFGLTAALIAIGLMIDLPLLADMAIKAGLLIAFPLILAKVGFLSENEQAALDRFLVAVKTRSVARWRGSVNQ